MTGKKRTTKITLIVELKPEEKEAISWSYGSPGYCKKEAIKYLADSVKSILSYAVSAYRKETEGQQ